MKTITVSESALDSIKRMGEADAARIAELEGSLRKIEMWATGDSGVRPRDLAMRDLSELCKQKLRVSPYVQTIVKGEN